jgi:hypothetical protein
MVSYTKSFRAWVVVAVGAVASGMLGGSSALAELTITGVGRNTPSGMLTGLSGITYAGGNQYYAVSDSGGLVSPLTISMDGNGTITSVTVGANIQLTGGGNPDLEGIAYRAAGHGGAGSLYVSDETGAGIREYSRDGSQHLSTVNVPTVYQNYRSNLSLESLTISADGNVMWTANEEALTVDGDVASFGKSTIVRLNKFVRSGDSWTDGGQFAYETRPGREHNLFTTEYASGVSDLCVLPDGQLLVLERSFGGRVVPSFDNEIFLIDTSLATDVSGFGGLIGASYTSVTKTSLWSMDFDTSDNFEGLTLGQQLSADTWSLLMVSDGDSVPDESLYSLRLQGVAVPEPSSLVLMALGCGGLGFLVFRKTKRKSRS